MKKELDTMKIVSEIKKNKRGKTTNYNFRIDPELKSRFDLFCQKNEITATDFLTKIIEDALSADSNNKIRSKNNL